MLQDLLFSLRELRKHPGIAITAILSLTLGIGATTAVFSVIYGLLVNPYPYLGADRMIELTVINENGNIRGVALNGPDLNTIRTQKRAENEAASWRPRNLTPPVETL